jgi:hypothetical protein
MTIPNTRWRKSSFSGGENSDCIELAGTLDAVRDSKYPAGPVLYADLSGLITTAKSQPTRWRKSRYSGGENDACVELADALDAVRDSKNPTGPVLRADVRGLLSSLRQGRLDG